MTYELRKFYEETQQLDNLYSQVTNPDLVDKTIELIHKIAASSEVRASLGRGRLVLSDDNVIGYHKGIYITQEGIVSIREPSSYEIWGEIEYASKEHPTYHDPTTPKNLSFKNWSMDIVSDEILKKHLEINGRQFIKKLKESLENILDKHQVSKIY